MGEGEREPKIGGEALEGRCAGRKIEVGESKTIPNVQSCTNLRTTQKSGKRKGLPGKSPKPGGGAQASRKRQAEVRDSESISPASNQQIRRSLLCRYLR